MSTFLYILTNIILPIALLVALGYLLQKKLKMDTRTFSRLNIYIFIPAVLFMKIYDAEVSMSFVGTVVTFVLVTQAIMILMAAIISRILKYPHGIRKAFSNSLVFYNNGNYGLPLTDLVFNGSALAMSAQVFVMVIQNITSSTLGVYQASSGKSTSGQALKKVLGMPAIYMIAIVIIVKATGYSLPEPALTPIRYLSDGFIGFALVTLGVQLAEVTAKFDIKSVLLTSFIRLILSPALGLLMVLILGVEGELAKALIIGISTPTAVNTAILAREFDNEPEYAAQNVFVSTLLSPITLSILIYLLNAYM